MIDNSSDIPGALYIRATTKCFTCLRPFTVVWDGIGRCPATRHLEQAGWRRRTRTWFCPDCAAKPTARVGPMPQRLRG